MTGQRANRHECPPEAALHGGGLMGPKRDRQIVAATHVPAAHRPTVASRDAPWNRTMARDFRESFTGRALRFGLVSANASPPLTARLTLTTLTAGTARPAHALRWPHLLQLLQLLRREDLLELRFGFGFQGRHLLELVGGQVQLLHGARGQQVKAALATGTAGTTAFSTRSTTGAAGAAFVTGRTLPFRALIVVLRNEQASGCAQRQREKDDFCFHDMCWCFGVVFTVFSPRSPSAPTRCSKQSGWSAEIVAGPAAGATLKDRFLIPALVS